MFILVVLAGPGEQEIETEETILLATEVPQVQPVELPAAMEVLGLLEK
jgi:hypothetical protein